MILLIDAEKLFYSIQHFYYKNLKIGKDKGLQLDKKSTKKPTASSILND